MPAYNAASYIRQSIQSILDQTYSSFELIIIDDCSTDTTVEVVNEFSDPRIQLIRKEKNSGYTISLNTGIGIAKGKYIARMDADDISMSQRFEKQLALLEANPNVILCGTGVETLNTGVTYHHPVTNDEIRIALLEYCAIAHPTVMFRKDAFLKNGLLYDPAMEPAEDYNLWVRACRFGQFQNIPEPLLKYRLHDNQVSVTKRAKQQRHTYEAINFHYTLLYQDDKPPLNLNDSTVPEDLNFSDQLSHFELYLREIENIKAINDRTKVLNVQLFNAFCAAKKNGIIQSWFLTTRSPSLKKLSVFFRNSYFKYFPNGKKLEIIFKCLNPFAANG